MLLFPAGRRRHQRDLGCASGLEGCDRRLVGAVLAEQNDEWAIARRYMSFGAITTVCSHAKAQAVLPAKEVQLAVTA